MTPQRALGQILVRHAAVNPDALEPLYAQQLEKSRGLVELVLESNLATERDVARALAAECRLPFLERIDLDAIPTDVATRLPITYAKNHHMLVVGESPEAVSVICADPLDTDGLDDVRAAFEKPIALSVAPAEVVVDAINRVFERGAPMGELEPTERDDDEQEIDILDSDEDAPIIRWVNGLLSQAVKERASDIHIEPEEREVIVRYRVDGQLYVAAAASTCASPASRRAAARNAS
jgi:general secretion pathway protein E